MAPKTKYKLFNKALSLAPPHSHSKFRSLFMSQGPPSLPSGLHTCPFLSPVPASASPPIHPLGLGFAVCFLQEAFPDPQSLRWMPKTWALIMPRASPIAAPFIWDHHQSFTCLQPLLHCKLQVAALSLSCSPFHPQRLYRIGNKHLSKWGKLNACGEHQISLIPIFPQLKTLWTSIKVWQIFLEKQIVNPTRSAFPYLNENSVGQCRVIMKCHKVWVSATWGPRVGVWSHPGNKQFWKHEARGAGSAPTFPLSSFPSQDTNPAGFHPLPIWTDSSTWVVRQGTCLLLGTPRHLGLFGWVLWLQLLGKEKTFSFFAAWNISSKKCGDYGNQIWLADSYLLRSLLLFCSSLWKKEFGLFWQPDGQGHNFNNPLPSGAKVKKETS